MLNDWSDRDPDPRNDRRNAILEKLGAALIILVGLVASVIWIIARI